MTYETTDEAETRVTASGSMQMAQAIGQMIAGKGDVMQGAVLGQLVATWLAGYHPECRTLALDRHVDLVKQLIPIEVKIAGAWPC